MVFENMITFISSTMIYHLFRDAFCCFADIVIITTFFGTFTMANQIKFMRKLCFIFDIKTGTLPWKATSLWILSGNRVFNLFFIDLIIKSTFWPWYGNTKTWRFRSVIGETCEFKSCCCHLIIYTSFVFFLLHSKLI